MLQVGIFNRPELTGKACSPSPDGPADWEMTEEDTKRKDAHVMNLKAAVVLSRKTWILIFLKLHNDPIRLANDFS